MAEKAKDKDTPVTNPEPANQNKVSLGQFIESLKKGMFNTQKSATAPKLEIPSNFLDEFKSISKTLESLNIKTDQVSTNTANTIKALQQLEKNILGSNKLLVKAIESNKPLQIKGLENVDKVLEEIKTNISKIKSTTPTEAVDVEPPLLDKPLQVKGIEDVNKTLNEVKTGINKLKSSSLDEIEVAPKKTEEVDTAAEALKKAEVQPIRIVDISDEASNKLDKLFSKLNIKGVAEIKKPAAAKPKATDETSLFDDIISSLGLKNLLAKSSFGKMLTSGLLSSLAGLGASLALAIGSWFNDGPFKGTMKLIGETGTKIFLPKVTKILSDFFPKLFEKVTAGLSSIGKSVGGLVTKLLPTAGVLGNLATKFLGFLTPVLKRLPVIGTIINIGSAISRFMKGDIVGGLIDIGSAVAVLIPGVGTAISFGLGLLNAARDLSGGGPSENAKSGANVSIKDFFGKASDWIKDKIKTAINYFFGKPIRAYDYFKKGDYVRGVVTLASFVPGLFWMENLYDWLAGPPPKPEPTEKGSPLPTDLLSQAWKWIKDKIGKVFNLVFGQFTKGWKEIKEGNIVQGLATWATLISPIAWIKPLYDWLAGTPEKINEKGEKEPAQPGMLSKAWDWLKVKIADKFVGSMRNVKRGWTDFQKGDYGRAISTWASIIPGLGWLEGLYKWAFGEREKEGQAKPEPGFVDNLWKNLKEGVSKKFEDAKKTVTETFTSFGKNISEAWDNTINWFKDLPGSVGELISKAWEDAKGFLSEKWEALKQGAKDLIDKPTELIKNTWSKLTTWFDETIAGVESFFEDPVGALKEMWESVTAKIKDAIMAPVNAVKKGWKKVTGWFGGLSEEEQTTEKNVQDANKLLGTNIKVPTETPKEALKKTDIKTIAETSKEPAKETKVAVVAPQVTNAQVQPNKRLAGEPVLPDKPLSAKQMEYAKMVIEDKNYGKHYIHPDILKKYEEQSKQQATTIAVKETKAEAVVPAISNTTKAVSEMAKPALSSTQITEKGIGVPTLQKTVEPETLIQKFKTPAVEIPKVAPVTKALQSIPAPLAPLEVPASPSVSAIKDLKTDLVDALKTKTAAPAKASKTTTVATVGNATTNAVTNSTNIFGNTLDRDIPYIERNKYRQTIIYNRNLL